jgi:hypothetical protein
MKENKKIFAFTDLLKDIIAFQKLGFKSEIDDAANEVYYVESDLTDYDWLAALALLEDCKREGLHPILQYGEMLIDGEEAIAFADAEAAEELN